MPRLDAKSTKRPKSISDSSLNPTKQDTRPVRGQRFARERFKWLFLLFSMLMTGWRFVRKHHKLLFLLFLLVILPAISVFFLAPSVVRLVKENPERNSPDTPHDSPCTSFKQFHGAFSPQTRIAYIGENHRQANTVNYCVDVVADNFPTNDIYIGVEGVPAGQVVDCSLRNITPRPGRTCVGVDDKLHSEEMDRLEFEFLRGNQLYKFWQQYKTLNFSNSALSLFLAQQEQLALSEIKQYSHTLNLNDYRGEILHYVKYVFVERQYFLARILLETAHALQQHGGNYRTYFEKNAKKIRTDDDLRQGVVLKVNTAQLYRRQSAIFTTSVTYGQIKPFITVVGQEHFFSKNRSFKKPAESLVKQIKEAEEKISAVILIQITKENTCLIETLTDPDSIKAIIALAILYTMLSFAGVKLYLNQERQLPAVSPRM